MVELVNRKNPRFSIIIPTYNTIDVLGQCIKSLYNQKVNMDCFEVIVVNDGGKSESSDSLFLGDDEFDIKYLYQEHKGPAAARNLGIEKARGEIILFLDDDSLPTENWLNATIKAWDKFPDFDGVGGFIISEGTDSIFCRVNADLFNWYFRQYSTGERCSFLSTCNCGYKKVILNKIGKFDEQFPRASGEDRDLNIKILLSEGKLRLDEDILVYHDKDLTLKSFARKYYNYGGAAHKIYTRYPEQERMSSKDYVNFYLSILKEYKTFKEKVEVFLLLTLSQVATITGYYSSVILKCK